MYNKNYKRCKDWINKAKCFALSRPIMELKKNTVRNWRRKHVNLERFASNECGAMTNRKPMKLAEYDKIIKLAVLYILYS